MTIKTVAQLTKQVEKINRIKEIYVTYSDIEEDEKRFDVNIDVWINNSWGHENDYQDFCIMTDTEKKAIAMTKRIEKKLKELFPDLKVVNEGYQNC